MNTEAEQYIRENRLKESMLDMSKKINTSYNKVRNYMIANNLTLSKAEINNVKIIKRNKPKRWDWDALP